MTDPSPDTLPRERLHKFLARAGVGSRRACEEFIEQGRVSVDGNIVQSMGFCVDPANQVVRFDDEIVRPEPLVYYLVYKPRGVICTTSDQFNRRSVVDLVRDRRKRLFPVGRLEEDSEGLIIVTNDGRLAHGIADYRRPLRHTYYVKVRGTVNQEQLDKIRGGVWLSDGRTSPMNVKLQRSGRKVSTLLVTPAAYQHRQLRRVMAKAGLTVERIVRVKIGPLGTRDLRKGEARKLTAEEVRELLDPRPRHVGESVTQKPVRKRPSDPTARPPRKRKGGPPSRRSKPPRGPSTDDRPPRRVIGP